MNSYLEYLGNAVRLKNYFVTFFLLFRLVSNWGSALNLFLLETLLNNITIQLFSIKKSTKRKNDVTRHVSFA